MYAYVLIPIGVIVGILVVIVFVLLCRERYKEKHRFPQKKKLAVNKANVEGKIQAPEEKSKWMKENKIDFLLGFPAYLVRYYLGSKLWVENGEKQEEYEDEEEMSLEERFFNYPTEEKPKAKMPKEKKSKEKKKSTKEAIPQDNKPPVIISGPATFPGDKKTKAVVIPQEYNLSSQSLLATRPIQPIPSYGSDQTHSRPSSFASDGLYSRPANISVPAAVENDGFDITGPGLYSTVPSRPTVAQPQEVYVISNRAQMPVGTGSFATVGSNPSSQSAVNATYAQVIPRDQRIPPVPTEDIPSSQSIRPVSAETIIEKVPGDSDVTFINLPPRAMKIASTATLSFRAKGPPERPQLIMAPNPSIPVGGGTSIVLEKDKVTVVPPSEPQPTAVPPSEPQSNVVPPSEPQTSNTDSSASTVPTMNGTVIQSSVNSNIATIQLD